MDNRWILDQYPLPIARCYRRYLNASQPRERHDHAYFLVEVYLKYSASIAIAGYLAREERDHRVNSVLKGLARPSVGEWLGFFRECLKFLAQREGGEPAARAMASLYQERDSRWTGVVELHNALCSFRTGGESGKKQVSLEMLLAEVVAYRNRVLGHGALLEEEHYRKFEELFAAGLGEVLEKSPHLTARRLVSFDSIQVREGSRLECQVIEFMGDRPIRKQIPHQIPYGAPAPPEKVLCLFSDGGEFLCLEPLMVAHREDVYLLNEAGGSPEYLSYSTGERYRPSEIGARQGELFHRILGYEVDAARLSRIGEDLAPAAQAAVGTPSGGKRMLGDYRIVREVGRGAMGTVFEAVQESLGRRVALKVLPGDFALDPKRLERFRREARATARIHHPSIVPVYDVGEAEGTHYYAMEYIDGPSLDSLLARTRKDAPERTSGKGSSTGDPDYIARAVEEIASVARGLAEAHGQGLVHRDVKPSNILVDSGGRYILIDFGLVREEEAPTLTRSGEMVGTLSYMSPEQVSRSEVDARSDIYSLAMTLYEILTLRAPFEGKSDHEIQRAILFEEPAPPRRHNPKLSRDLETILLHALEKNPRARYPSAREFADDLRRFLRYEPIRARAISLPERAWRWGRRRAGVLTMILLLVIGGLLSGLFALQSHGERLERLKTEAEAKLWTAERYHSEGRYPEALSTIGEVLKEKPALLEARLLRARVLADLDRDLEAIAELEALSRERPEEGAIHFLLAALYQDLDADKAREYRRLSEKFAASSADALHLRAISSGWSRETLKLLDEALEEDPRHYPSRKARTVVDQAWKDYAAMERDADALVLLRPQDATGWSLRGVARRELGKLTEALKDHDRAVKLAPRDPEILSQRRETHIRMGKSEDALADARLCAEIRPEDIGLRFQFFQCLMVLGRFEEANAEYQKAIGSGQVNREEFDLWAKNQVFRMLGSGQELRLPPPEECGPAFLSLYEAAEYYRALDAKADRLLSRATMATWSPDGGEIAYSGGWLGSNGLEVLDLRSGRTRLLTFPAKDLVWSPDGSVIAFVRDRKTWRMSFFTRERFRMVEALEWDYEYHEEVWTITPAGDGLRQIAKGGYPSFGRDPKRVYFHSRDEMALFSMRIDDPEAKPRRLIECHSSYYPVVSPDDRYVAYGVGHVLHVVELTTGSTVATWEAPLAAGLLVAWSPDGREMSVGGYGYDQLGLWIYDLERKECSQVIDGDATRGHWSSDRTQFVFDLRGDYHELWTVRLDPGVPTPRSFGVTRTVKEHILDLLQKTYRDMENAEKGSGLMSRGAVRLDEILLYLNEKEPELEPLLVAAPRLPPYGAIDCLVSHASARKQDQWQSILERFRGPSQEEEAQKRLLYLEGKVLEQSGNVREAAWKFGEIVARAVSRPEPILGFAGGLRTLGEHARAEVELRRGLEKGLPDDQDLWTLWAAIHLSDQKETPAQVISSLPISGAAPSPGSDDLRWLLERLEPAAPPIRIDCGQKSDEVVRGEGWSRDRFFLSGKSAMHQRGEVAQTDLDPIYHTQRGFPGKGPRAGYRLPLAPGEYRIKLHFAEGDSRSPGERLFDVWIEEKEVLKDYEPLRAGFATADVQTFDAVDVKDGLLDIRFVRRVGNPFISAIEIERRG